MSNPLYSILGRGNNNIMRAINMARQIAGGNPQSAFQMMMRNNPAFASFVNQNQGKSVEQIAQENGIDIEQIKSMLR